MDKADSRLRTSRQGVRIPPGAPTYEDRTFLRGRRGASLAALLGSFLGILAAPTAAGTGPLSSYVVAPCRFVDTRDDFGMPGQPPGPVQSFRFYQVQGHCGVPAGARALLVNVTATEATVAGHLVLFDAAVTAIPGAWIVPPTSNLNFVPGRTVANLALVELGELVFGDEADLALYAHVPGGSVHIILDVVAYLQ